MTHGEHWTLVLVVCKTSQHNKNETPKPLKMFAKVIKAIHQNTYVCTTPHPTIKAFYLEVFVVLLKALHRTSRGLSVFAKHVRVVIFLSFSSFVTPQQSLHSLSF